MTKPPIANKAAAAPTTTVFRVRSKVTILPPCPENRDQRRQNGWNLADPIWFHALAKAAEKEAYQIASLDEIPLLGESHPLYTIGMTLQFTTSYIEDSLAIFRYYKKLAERAMEQVTDEQLFVLLDDEANSIAIIVKHMAGNMRSRWTDFLTADGEKPDRHRDTEFVDPPATRAALMAEWERGWECVFGAIEPLTDADLGRTITIRGEAHSVMQAINRQLAHYPHHVGQVVLLAKHFVGERWKSLSVPRNQSAEFNRKVAAGEASQR